MKKLFPLLILFLSLFFISKAQITKDSLNFVKAIESSNTLCSDTVQIIFIWSFPELIEKDYVTRKGYLVTYHIVRADTIFEIKKVYSNAWAAIDMNRIKKIIVKSWKF